MPAIPEDINEQVVFEAEQLQTLKDSSAKDALGSSTPTESSSLLDAKEGYK